MLYSIKEIAEKSLPMRGEWIEIAYQKLTAVSIIVSPHAGRVD